MAFWNKFPFTNFHEMNLNWLISTMKDLVNGYDNFTTEATKKIEAQNEKIDTFVNDYTKKVDKIPQLVQTETIDIMDRYRADGTFSEIIESTYGAVSYLNTLQNKSLLILGDSLSDPKKCAWVTEFRKLVANINMTVTNHAVAGETLEQQATRFESITTKFDILFIWCGINDIAKQRSLSDVTASLDKIRAHAETINPKAQVYLVSTYKNKRNLPENWIIPQIAYWRLYSTYCVKYGWNYIDGFGKAPIINVTDATTTAWCFQETPNLHYTEKYAPILAQWFLHIMSVGENMDIARYYEHVPGANVVSGFTFKPQFTPDKAGCFVDYGTDRMLIRLFGTFKPENNTGHWVEVCTVPEVFRPATSYLFTLAVQEGGVSSTGASITCKATIASNGKIFIYGADMNAISFNSAKMYLSFDIPFLDYDFNRPY